MFDIFLGVIVKDSMKVTYSFDDHLFVEAFHKEIKIISEGTKNVEIVKYWTLSENGFFMDACNYTILNIRLFTENNENIDTDIDVELIGIILDEKRFEIYKEIMDSHKTRKTMIYSNFPYKLPLRDWQKGLYKDASISYVDTLTIFAGCLEARNENIFYLPEYFGL
jgi:hypothetical protein